MPSRPLRALGRLSQLHSVPEIALLAFSGAARVGLGELSPSPTIGKASLSKELWTGINFVRLCVHSSIHLVSPYGVIQLDNSALIMGLASV